jgi:sulfoxide reductase heme-binding subunit YedZ
LLTASLLLGITEATRWISDRWPRFVTAGIHKNVSLLATTFIGVHVATAIVDGFAPIGWTDAVLPFRSTYRPVWLGLGAVAFDLLLALSITSLLRRHIGYRTWRLVHWAAYACWPIALVHGLGTGTDTKTNWVLGLEFACMAAVVVAVWWRVVAAGWPVRERRRVLAASISSIVPFIIAGWVLLGPLQPGWARRAGTPASLLGGTASDAAATGAVPSPDAGQTSSTATSPPVTSGTSTLTPSFDASLNGTLTDPGPDDHGNDTITIEAQLDSGATGSVHLVLSGRALDDGGISLESSTVELAGRTTADAFTGAVTALRGDVVDAQLHSSTGSSLALELDLVLQGSAVTGRAHGVGQ